MSSTNDKIIARAIAAVLGGTPTVSVHADAGETSKLAVMVCEDAPSRNLYSFSTVGLSDTAIAGRVLPQPPLGSEILAVSNEEDFALVVSTAGFCVVNSGWVAEPGSLFPNVVGMHFEDTTVPHLLFVTPYLWDPAPPTLTLEAKTVAWAMGVPVSDAERAYRREHGWEALEALFEEHDPDFIDLERDSVA